MLQHAWAEFEHDIRYKGTVPAEHASEFDRRFTLAAGLLELADQEFTAIRERLRTPAPAAEDPDDEWEDGWDDPRIAPRELAAFLAGQYADAGWSRPDHYSWISGLLLELGITSLVELGEVLRSADHAHIAARMDYRYPPGAVRRLDDALLALFGQRYVDLHGNAHRRDALGNRLQRLSGGSPRAAGTVQEVVADLRRGPRRPVISGQPRIASAPRRCGTAARVRPVISSSSARSSPSMTAPAPTSTSASVATRR